MYYLFSAQQANARRESPFVETAEVKELRRSDDVVDGIRIVAVRNIVEASAQRPIMLKGMKTFLNVRVPSEVSGKAVGTGGQNQLLLRVDYRERKSAPNFHRVSKIETLE